MQAPDKKDEIIKMSDKALPSTGAKCSRECQHKQCSSSNCRYSTLQLNNKYSISKLCSHILLESVPERKHNTHSSEFRRASSEAHACEHHKIIDGATQQRDNRSDYKINHSDLCTKNLPECSFKCRGVQHGLLKHEHTHSNTSPVASTDVSDAERHTPDRDTHIEQKPARIKRASRDDLEIAHMLDGTVINPGIPTPTFNPDSTPERSLKTEIKKRKDSDSQLESMYKEIVDIATVVEEIHKKTKTKLAEKRVDKNPSATKLQNVRYVKPADYMKKLRAKSNKAKKSANHKVTQKLSTLSNVSTQTNAPIEVAKKESTVQTYSPLLLNRGCQVTMETAPKKKEIIGIDKSTETPPLPQTKKFVLSKNIQVPEKNMEKSKRQTPQSGEDSTKPTQVSQGCQAIVEVNKLDEVKSLDKMYLSMYTQTDVSQQFKKLTPISNTPANDNDDNDVDASDDSRNELQSIDVWLPIPCANISPQKIEKKIKYKDQLIHVLYIVILGLVLWGIYYAVASKYGEDFISYAIECFKVWYHEKTENPSTRIEKIIAYIWKAIS